MRAAGAAFLAFGVVLGASVSPAAAQSPPPGMIPYDHPVYKNGKRVLWHGPGRDEPESDKPAASSTPAAKAEAPAGAGARTMFTLVADGDDACASRMVEELSAALRAAGLRSKVAVGRGGPAALAKYIDGDDADFAIAPIDALANDKNAGNWRDRAPFVARLARETIEIIARTAVSDMSALEGKRVAVGPAGGSSEVVATHVFQGLGIAPKFVTESVSQGLIDLASGRVDAVFAVGETSSRTVAQFGKSGGFHLAAAPVAPALQAAYAPVRLTHAERPNLIGPDEKVDTLSAGMAMIALDAAPNSERAQRDAAVIAPLFDKYSTLLQAGTDPSWREVNLAASAPWPRLNAATAWLDAHGGSDAGKLDAFRQTVRTLPPTGPGEADADRLYQSLMALQGGAP